MPLSEESVNPLEAMAGEEAPVTAADLVERYADAVYNLAVRLTGDRDEARDLAQDAFVRILKGAATFRGESSPKTWIFQVVINCHRNRSRWWRRLKRGRTVSLDAPTHDGDDRTPAETLADTAPGPERVARGRQEASLVQRALAELPATLRAALLLREVEGMSYAEIAVSLGVREGTVKSRLARAREALRLALPGGGA